jgi:hypothetical protein
MRKLALALTAATILAGTVPASAQSFYAGVGSGPAWGYDAWGWERASAYGYGPGFYGPGFGVGFYGGGPVADSYAYVDRPRYRVRRVVRTTRVVRSYDPAFSAYAYAPYAYAGPSVSVGFGFGPGWGRTWW